MTRRTSLDLKRETAVTALVVDHGRSFHDLVRRVLGEAVRIVGATDSGEWAVWQAGAARPHVVLMDVGVPEIEGVAVARLVKAASPRTKVILLTAHDEEAHLTRVGKWLRRFRLDELSQLIKVLRGDVNLVKYRLFTEKILFSPRLAGRLEEGPGMVRALPRASL